MNSHHSTQKVARHRVTSFSEARAEARQRRARQIRGLQRDDGFDRFRPLGARRALVVVGYLMLLGAGILAWLDHEGPASVAAPLVFLLGLGVAVLLRRTIRNTDELDDEALDERLAAVRDSAFRKAYVGVVWSVLGALLLVMIGVGEGVEHRHLQALFYAFALGAVLTPVAVLAWSEPKV